MLSAMQAVRLSVFIFGLRPPQAYFFGEAETRTSRQRTLRRALQAHSQDVDVECIDAKPPGRSRGIRPLGTDGKGATDRADSCAAGPPSGAACLKSLHWTDRSDYDSDGFTDLLDDHETNLSQGERSIYVHWADNLVVRSVRRP